MRPALSLLTLALLTSAAFAQETTLTIDTTRTGPRLSPLQHGIFFEEINHAGDGGLYPEKLRNRDFSEGTAFWETFGGASASTDSDVLVLQGPGGVRTEGYWGIAVEKGKSYQGSLILEGTGVKQVDVALVTPTGATLAATTIKLAPRLTGYTFVLKPGATCPDSRLEVRLGAGKLRLRQPSLLPQERWGQSGLRPDLAKIVAAMKPSFVRFPGGCFVEGDTLAQRFNWKTSLGPVPQRGKNQCIWGYKATNGLGFHEYLQWCEDMQSEPLFVVNCGMSHRDIVPLAEMDRVVQDALDALEYANGDAKTTKWGAERAKNGHPKPFGLKLIEIGNENGGPRYNERYKLVYDAIKAKWPQTRLIANDWGGIPTSAPVEIIDEHYYNTPQFFLQQANRYDSYSRSGPKIYVGEYAVTQGCGEGNLIAALGEAAFMTGMERNADVVIMGSYAPLFVHAKDRKWNPDAIVFDSARSFGTPSYWVQQLFSANRGDVVLPTTLTQPPQATAAPSETRGGVGVATWRTDAEFADLRVDGKPVTLTPQGGKWEKTADGGWRQADFRGEDFRAVGGDPQASNYTLTLRARKNAGDEGFLIMFYVRGTGEYLWWNLGGWNNTRHEIERAIGGAKSPLVRPARPGKIETGRWYDIKVVCAGPRVRCYLDGTLIHDITLPPPPSVLHAVTTRDDKTGDILVKLVNAGEKSQEINLQLSGVTALRQGTATVLSGAQPTDENSFDNPNRIAPVTLPLSGVGPRFRYTAPAWSVSFLRLKTR